MRCKNCGWENPANNAKCEKCNALMTGSSGEQNDHSSSENPSSGGFDPKKTAKGCPECGYPQRGVEKSCPQCGHIFAQKPQDPPADKKPKPRKVQQPVPDPTSAAVVSVEKTCAYCKNIVPEAAHFCPNCGASLTNAGKNPDDTVKPWVRVDQMQTPETPECSLTFISKDDEPANDATLRFSGNAVQLNRGNTEPANQTITSKVQAELTFENDQWYLQDKSALKTTYIYAGDRIGLKSGDVIVLGNRSFTFKNLSEKQPE